MSLHNDSDFPEDNRREGYCEIPASHRGSAREAILAEAFQRCQVIHEDADLAQAAVSSVHTDSGTGLLTSRNPSMAPCGRP